VSARNKYVERIIPSETSERLYFNHLKRYEFARAFVDGKHVLDLACGVGYGTAYLADAAQHAVGVDVSWEAIEYAVKHYNRANVSFAQGDALMMPFSSSSFDAVISFETIEHVPDAELYLAEVKRLLKPNGVYIVSTPAAKTYTRTPANPYHVQEWPPAEFEALLRRFFSSVALYSQHELKQAAAVAVKKADRFNLRLLIPKPARLFIARALGLRTMYDVKMEHITITPGVHPDATETVCVCQ